MSHVPNTESYIAFTEMFLKKSFYARTPLYEQTSVGKYC